MLSDPAELAEARGRAMVVRRLRPLPIEAIVRGYLIGSGWREYRATGSVCGIGLPEGLRQAERLPEPLFTPSTKAEAGEHDENIDFDTACRLIGPDVAGRVRDVALDLYRFAAEHARARGIIIADTKFEFAVDGDGGLVLIDEVLTPDSSRFWPADEYAPGDEPAELRQAVRARLPRHPRLGQAPARPRPCRPRSSAGRRRSTGRPSAASSPERPGRIAAVKAVAAGAAYRRRRQAGQGTPRPVETRREQPHQPGRRPSSSISCSRIRNFCGLPVAVTGISETKRTCRGTL